MSLDSISWITSPKHQSEEKTLIWTTINTYRHNAPNITFLQTPFCMLLGLHVLRSPYGFLWVVLLEQPEHIHWDPAQHLFIGKACRIKHPKWIWEDQAGCLIFATELRRHVLHTECLSWRTSWHSQLSIIDQLLSAHWHVHTPHSTVVEVLPADPSCTLKDHPVYPVCVYCPGQHCAGCQTLGCGCQQYQYALHLQAELDARSPQGGSLLYGKNTEGSLARSCCNYAQQLGLPSTALTHHRISLL